MAAEVKKEIELEIAHVLFIDFVDYSKLSVNEQHARIAELNEAVRLSEQFQRAEAINRMRRALDMFIVEGPMTSIPLHQKILAHPDFQRGDIYTAFLEHMNDPVKNRGIA